MCSPAKTHVKIENLGFSSLIHAGRDITQHQYNTARLRLSRDVNHSSGLCGTPFRRFNRRRNVEHDSICVSAVSGSSSAPPFPLIRHSPHNALLENLSRVDRELKVWSCMSISSYMQIKHSGLKASWALDSHSHGHNRMCVLTLSPARRLANTVCCEGVVHFWPSWFDPPSQQKHTTPFPCR